MATAVPSELHTSAVTDQRSRRSPGLTLAVPVLLCGLGALCLTVDIPVAAFFRTGKPLKFLRELLDNAEPFGHGFGVALIVLAVYVLDASRRSWAPTLLAGSLGGGLAADTIKLLVSRTRPRNLDLSLTTAWQTFGELLPLVNGAEGDSHSFPSAHTATATGFAVILAEMYPHGRGLFYFLAALTGLQRIQCSAHFPSDVCIGAAVGWLVGQGVLVLRQQMRGTGSAVADGGL